MYSSTDIVVYSSTDNHVFSSRISILLKIETDYDNPLLQVTERIFSLISLNLTITGLIVAGLLYVNSLFINCNTMVTVHGSSKRFFFNEMT